MSAAKTPSPLDEIQDAAACRKWAGKIVQLFRVKYKPLAAAIAVAREVASALEQSAIGLEAGANTPAKMRAFAAAMSDEAAALERAAGPAPAVLTLTGEGVG